MRIIESLLSVALLVSYIRLGMGSGKQEKLVQVGLISLMAVMSIVCEGFRFVMIPLYILSVIRVGIGVVNHLSLLKKQYKVMKWMGMGLMGFLYIIGVGLALFMGVVDLPEPTGPQLVGTMTMDFINPFRTALLTDETESQKIAVQVWYPAASRQGCERVNWMRKEEVHLFEKEMGMPSVFGQLAFVKTNSYKDAPLADETEAYPVVLFSAGAGMFRGMNVVQMEELASHGYVVFAVSHPGDDFATVYEDGTILGSDEARRKALSKDISSALAVAEKQFPEEQGAEFQHAIIQNATLYNKQVGIWAEDLSFVADQIIKLNKGEMKSIFAERLNVDAMGAFGHSFGGAAAGEVSLTDSRFKAFINMDGTPFGKTEHQVIDKPFMILTTDSGDTKKLKVCEGYAKNQKNYEEVAIKGSEHMNFTDLNVVLPHIGKVLGVLGTIDPKDQIKRVNGEIVSFFGEHL